MRDICTSTQDSCAQNLADREAFWTQLVFDYARLPWATAVMSIPICDLTPGVIADRLRVYPLHEVLFMSNDLFERFQSATLRYLQNPLSKRKPLFGPGTSENEARQAESI